MNPSVEVGRLREAFDRAGYNEPRVRERLSTSDLTSFQRRLRSLPHALRQTRTGTPLDVLIRLFLLRQPVSLETAAAALAPAGLDEWATAGLLRVGPTDVRAIVQVQPCQGLLLAADWPDLPPTAGEAVMEVAGSSLALAQVTIRRRVARALDLGTGCGVQALLAAAHSDHVRAVDLNPRALPMARFNARLNGLSNVECVQGNLFEPVRGQTFDLIVCNPPFVIAPGQGPLHTHGGQPIDGLCRAIVRAAPDLLSPGGYCQLVCNWAHLAGRNASERLVSWFEGTGCDAWALCCRTEDAATYAMRRVHETTDDPAQAARLFDEWMAYYEQEEIEAVSFGVIALRRTDGRPNWVRCDAAPEFVGACGAVIEQRFRLRDLLRSHRDDRDLLACRFRPADNLCWEVRQHVSAGGWTLVESRLRLADGLAFGGKADGKIVAFVAECRTGQSLREHLRRLAAGLGKDADGLAPEFLRVVRQLIEAGYLVPAEPPGV